MSNRYCRSKHHENAGRIQEVGDEGGKVPDKLIKPLVFLATLMMVVIGAALLMVAWRIHSQCMHGSAGCSEPSGGQYTPSNTTNARPLKEFVGQSLSVRDTEPATQARASVADRLQATRWSMFARIQSLGASLAGTVGSTLKYLAAKLESVAQIGTPKVRVIVYVTQS